MEPNLHIIQYKGRSATNNSRSSNFTISLTGEASRSGFLLQPEISKFSTDSVDSIQVGIITLRPSDKDLQSAWRPHAASLVLELSIIHIVWYQYIYTYIYMCIQTRR